MPTKKPFFISKRTLSRIDKINELQEKEMTESSEPAKVNNFKTANKATFGKSRNVHTPIKKDDGPGTKTQEVNNVEVNKPIAATSLNEYPAPTIKRRNVEEMIPAVNGKAAPHLVHKPKKKSDGQNFFPVIEKQSKKKPRKKTTTKKTT